MIEKVCLLFFILTAVFQTFSYDHKYKFYLLLLKNASFLYLIGQYSNSLIFTFSAIILFCQSFYMINNFESLKSYRKESRGLVLIFVFSFSLIMGLTFQWALEFETIGNTPTPDSAQQSVSPLFLYFLIALLIVFGTVKKFNRTNSHE